MFQFHKGAIRTTGVLVICRKITRFNSIKVRLERCAAIPTELPKLFQFHKGAIRTLLLQEERR